MIQNLYKFLVALQILLVSPWLFAQEAKLVDLKDFLTLTQESKTLSSDQNREVEKIRALKAVKTIATFKLATEVSAANVIAIALPGGSVAKYSKERIEKHPGNVLIWRGLSVGRDSAVLAFQAGLLSGTIEWQGRIFEIRSLGGGFHAIVEHDKEKLPPLHPPSIKEGSSVPATNSSGGAATNMGSVGQPASTLAAATTINILFAFTPNGAANIGTTRESAVAQAISEINATMINSGLAISAASVGIASSPVDYLDAGIALSRIKTLGLQQARDAANADVVIVYGLYSTCIGLAPIYPKAEDAFSVVSASCLYKYRNTVHELGHILGGRHDIFADGSSSPFSDGHGFFQREPSLVFPGKYQCRRSIMTDRPFASNALCVDGFDNWVSAWSSPEIPPGFTTPLGNPIAANMKRVVSVAAPVISTFRNTKMSAGLMSKIMQVIEGLLNDD